MEFYAHTAQGPGGKQLSDKACWQLLREHLCRVAELARGFAMPLNLAAEAELAGLLHDLGKYSKRFQARLSDNSIHGINHWAAGAVHAGANLKQLSVAFAVDGHHAGIPALDGNGGLKQCVKRSTSSQEWNEFTRCEETLPELLECLQKVDGIRLPKLPSSDATNRFAYSLRTRMLFSCLVDADFLDTELHFDSKIAADRFLCQLEPERALQILSGFLASKSDAGEVNQRRRQLLSDCLSAAAKPPGLFTLTAPTGSGKTLSSLAFALQHIVNHNSKLSANDPGCLRRIIVVIPFTSIIEQTAQVYREIFEPIFGPECVLEHHSAVAPRERDGDCNQDAETERVRRARLASENWVSPIVVTTSVQFFESLFSNRPSDCRKLHNIGRSVIIFDEVQTLPARLVPSLLSAVRLLTQKPYGSTAVFMTATQPAFASAGKALQYGWDPIEISSQPEAMSEALRRTRVELPQRDERISWENVAQKLRSNSQALCVVNTTKDARHLFQLLQSCDLEGLFHLSSRMCPAHRREKLDAIRKRLHSGLPCRLVSTQLIEAGVDVDFPIAYRALGPLDSIIQTAGRCNREGRCKDRCPVIVFRPMEGGLPRGAYGVATAKTEEFLERHPEAASQVHSPAFYTQYFSELYGLLGPQSALDDPVFKACKELDFPKAAEECRLVSDETHAVLVKWTTHDGKNRGDELAQKLHIQKHLTAAECREAQRFSVNLYETEFLKAKSNGYVYQPANGWDFWVWNSDYNDHLGLGHLDMDSFIQ